MDRSVVGRPSSFLARLVQIGDQPVGLGKAIELKTKADAEAYVQSVCERIRQSFGPLPEKTPLNAKVTRTVGAVFHLTRWLSPYINYAETFNPPSAIQRIDSSFLPPTVATGTDIGVRGTALRVDVYPNGIEEIIFDFGQATYLAGMAAAAVSKSGVIATIGGTELPPVRASFRAFVDDLIGQGKTNKPWTVFLSMVVQFFILGILILIPLIYTDTLPKAQLASFLVAPPPPPPPRRRANRSPSRSPRSRCG